MSDQSADLVERVVQAAQERSPLALQGGGSKAFIGGAPAAADDTDNGVTTLSVTGHSGIISYEPTELVVTVRAGTPLAELEKTVTEAGQMLPFEPPRFAGATIGGTIACGLSGPRRPWAGAARDFVLGMRIINGQGQDLHFGGEVMKNVAGYDVSRLHVGAYGTLGVLLDMSMKVMPLPEAEMTLLHRQEQPDAMRQCDQRRPGSPGHCPAPRIIGRERYLRFSGSVAALRAAQEHWQGEADRTGRRAMGWPAGSDSSILR